MVVGLLGEELEPQEGPHALRERLLVVPDGRGILWRDVFGGVCHTSILRQSIAVEQIEVAKT